MNYYYAVNGQPVGPVSIDELHKLAANGTLTPDSPVIGEGQSEWRPYSTFTKREGANPGTLPSPPPPPAPAPIPVQPAQPSMVQVKAKQAASDAWSAFKILADNPVGNMADAFARLGSERALGTGIVFGVVTAGVFAFVSYHFFSNLGLRGGDGFEVFFKSFLAGLIPFACFWMACLLARSTLRGHGSAGHDAFVAGVAYLPAIIWFAAALLIGDMRSFTSVALVAPIPLCLIVLLLNAGLTRVIGVSEKAATWLTPCIIVVTGWVLYQVGSSSSRGLF